MASTSLHEDAEKIGPAVIDTHRAITSLMEEFEAVDWYNQRIHATDDASLKEILTHNRDEEKEHAVMVLEWLRRKDPALNNFMKTFLFKEGPIKEQKAGGAPAAPAKSAGSLGIGSLKQVP